MRSFFTHLLSHNYFQSSRISHSLTSEPIWWLTLEYRLGYNACGFLLFPALQRLNSVRKTTLFSGQNDGGSTCVRLITIIHVDNKRKKKKKKEKKK
uniref:Uncharacterized protein n=1 Tax=Anguilla anguilla TaxID=7936 RepID=A0A0E9U264_ANGAN